MDEYYCPNCNAILNDQNGFNPDNGSWTCTACGTHLMDDDVYDGDTFQGVAWYCDGCGALLNRQDGFSDSYDSWECTECGYLNGTTESDIINDGPQCPNCDSFLKKQSYYRGYEDDWTCEECGSKLHRDYGCDSYVVVYEEEGARCPNCDAALNDQYSFHRWKRDYVCDGCGAKLHRRSDDEPFSVIVEEQRPECPNCGACLEDQEDYYSFEDDWICEECGAKLHRDFSFEPYEIVYEDEYDDDCDDDLDEDEDNSYQEQCQTKREYGGCSRKQSQARKIVGLVFGILATVIVLAVLLQAGHYMLQQRIPMEFSFDSLEGMEYTEAVQTLKEAGFKNVRAKEISDLPLSREDQENVVTDVWMLFGGFFNDDTQYPIYMRITVEYHTLELLNPPISSKDAKGENYRKIIRKFEREGFTNITLQVEYDLLTGWIIDDGAVKSITIDGDKNYSCSDEYRSDVEVVITYHAFRNEKPSE